MLLSFAHSTFVVSTFQIRKTVLPVLSAYAINHQKQLREAQHNNLREIASFTRFKSLGKEIQSDKERKSLHFSYLTLNTCNPVIVQTDPELYTKYAWIKRLPRMMQVIADEKPDIIGFQEICDEENVRAILELWKALPHNYDIVSFRNNPSGGSFINVIAYNKKRFICENVQRWWASETPNIFSDPWGTGWGRVSLMATFYPLITKEMRGRKIISPDYEWPAIQVVNVHRGLKHIERLNSNKVDLEQIQKRIDPQNSIVLIGGDFNSFPDDGGEKEMEVLKCAGYTDLLSLKTQTGIPVSGTFPGYPYDKYKSLPGTLGNQLDHIFGKVYTPSYSLIYCSYVNAKKYNGKPEVNARRESDFLQATTKDDVEDRDFPSDHLPGIVHMIITKNKN
jgi:endonuclease/exonuclease/phosphatase family metal-dependent hydrolase